MSRNHFDHARNRKWLKFVRPLSSHLKKKVNIGSGWSVECLCRVEFFLIDRLVNVEHCEIDIRQHCFEEGCYFICVS